MSAAVERHQRTCERARACDGGAQLNLRELADLAWFRYQHWLQRQAQLPRTQLELLDAYDVPAQVREWRGIWLSIEREIRRVEVACA